MFIVGQKMEVLSPPGMLVHLLQYRCILVFFFTLRLFFVMGALFILELENIEKTSDSTT